VKISFIIPVYNRPGETRELLQSLSSQTEGDFEVIIVEDGSTESSEAVVENYREVLDISYFYKDNSGPGPSRNFGSKKAKGEYLIFLDSDCVLPGDYFRIVRERLEQKYTDAFGGPDKAHKDFTSFQKAINFSMTSSLTTGGIRNKKRALGGFSPKSFNMGISRTVFDTTGGYIIPFKGEDIEFGTRIQKMGYKIGLIEEAYVYHKRRTSWYKFFRQIMFFGTARINIARFFPDQLKLVHFFPAFFTIGLLLTMLLWLIYPSIAKILTAIYSTYFIILFIDAIISTRNLWISILGIWAAFLQLTAYGIGLLQELLVWLFKK